ncbi:MAG TPA: peptide deformylase [Fimbriimonadales bacterium]|nr:peptide deformylase [Fimbriimonadales bacterium]
MSAPVIKDSFDIVVPEEFRHLWEYSKERPVVKYPAEVLRKKAAPVEQVDKKIKKLIQRMTEVVEQANGIGLAAPQIGESLRVIVIAIPDKPIQALINPEILKAEGEAVGVEGCLSLPGLYGEVKRAERVEVSYLSPEGRLIRTQMEDLAARVVQHEIDHLDGILFIDRADLSTLRWEIPAGAEQVG